MLILLAFPAYSVLEKAAVCVSGQGDHYDAKCVLFQRLPLSFFHNFLEINTFNLIGLANIKDQFKKLQWCICPGTPETM